MDIYYVEDRDYDKKLKTNEYSDLPYLSKKALKKVYPKGGCILIGGIGEGMKERVGDFHLTGELHPYYTLHYSKFHYGIAGYVCVGDDNYLAIVKNRLPRNILLLLLSLALLTGLLFGGARLLSNSALDPNAKDFTPNVKIPVKTDKNHIAFPGYGDLKMEAGKDTAYVALWNPPDNPCYFKFIITRTDNEEVLYESKLIAPNKAVTEVTFNKAIPQGVYDIAIKIETYSLDDKDVPMNGGVINTRLVAIKRD